MTRLILAVLLIAAASRSAQEPTPYDGAGESPALTGTPRIQRELALSGAPPPPAAVNVTASEPSGTSSMPGLHSNAVPAHPTFKGHAYPVKPGDADNATAGNGAGTASGTILIGGTATWFCGGGSRCTRGHSPSELIAAIDPTLGIPKGSDVTVTHGGRSVRVRIVDVCACAGRRIIDLSRLAFSRLADPSRGVIPVEVTYGEGPRPTPPATDTEAP